MKYACNPFGTQRRRHDNYSLIIRLRVVLVGTRSRYEYRLDGVAPPVVRLVLPEQQAVADYAIVLFLVVAFSL